MRRSGRGSWQVLQTLGLLKMGLASGSGAALSRSPARCFFQDPLVCRTFLPLTNGNSLPCIQTCECSSHSSGILYCSNQPVDNHHSVEEGDLHNSWSCSSSKGQQKMCKTLDCNPPSIVSHHWENQHLLNQIDLCRYLYKLSVPLLLTTSQKMQ